MPRLLVHVEGQTEEEFVNEVLRPHLFEFGYDRVDARLVGSARMRANRGGGRPWSSVKGDIVRHLREDGECFATMMIDYYGMPQSHNHGYPGRAAASSLAMQNRASSVEGLVLAEIQHELNGDAGRQRFVPFVLMHEFESLLFSDCNAFAKGVGMEHLAPSFQAIRDQFGTPEEINDSPLTAPSKRVAALIHGYQKPLYGNLAALEIGLPAMRAECPGFHEWLSKLEALP
jgi:hypothetical protein